MNQPEQAKAEPAAPVQPPDPPPQADQLTLWDNQEEEAAVLSALRGGPDRYSGKIALGDQERAHRIAKLRMLGHSLRYVSRQTGADLRTVRAVEVELRRQGKLPAEREELAGQFTEIARVSNEKLLEALDRNKVPVNILPVAAGVAADKRAMLLGEAAGTTVNVQVNVNLDVVAGLKAAIQAAVAGKEPGTDEQSVSQTIDIEPLTHDSPANEGTRSPE